MFTVSMSVQTIIDCNTTKVKYNQNIHVSIFFLLKQDVQNI